MFKKSWVNKTEVYSIDGFLKREAPKYVEGGELPGVLKQTARVTFCLVAADAALDALQIIQNGMSVESFHLYHNVAHAATNTVEGRVSKPFDEKIWPLMLDIGKPLSKTMIALGIYKCIRGDVTHGWPTCYRAGLGLVALYLIDGAIAVLVGVGEGMKNG